jgi:hypothetical protein
MTTKQTILNQLADEAQHVAKTTIVDLDGFLALHGDERARRWRGLDHGAKFQLVAQQLERVAGDWTDELVRAFIAKYDERYALPPVEAAVEGALERLATEHADYARQARAAGEKADAKHFQRAANAYAKALGYYQAGVRPEPTARGGWMLPSQREHGAPHLLTRDGDWVCTCESGAHIHWASALIIGIEVAYDALDSGVSGEAEPADARPECDGAGCNECDGAGCNECDGSPLSDEEIADQIDPFPAPAQIASLRDRIAAARAVRLAA